VIAAQAAEAQARLTLTLSAKVTHPAGHTGTVKKRIKPKLKRKRRRR